MNLNDFNTEIAVPFVKHFEGFRAEAYKCPAGVWTIGYGHTKDVKKGDTVTVHQAEIMLSFDLSDIARELAAHVTRDDLTEAQCVALCSLAFNVGVPYMVRSCPKLMAAVKSGDDTEAALQFLDITRAGGKVLPGLERRRKAEAYLYRHGFSHEIL